MNFVGLSISFFPLIALFVLTSFVTFYIPGSYFIRSKHFSIPLHVLLSFVLGLILWGFQAFILGYLHVRFISYLYIGTCLFLAILQRKMFLNDLSRIGGEIRSHKLLILFVVIGTALQLLPVIGSGLQFQDGVRFFGVNGKDGVMHLAYIRSIIRTFPPQDPGAAGILLTNYHYWSDMIIADFIRIWKFPTSATFFQLFPILISALTALSGYQLMRVLGYSKIAGIWAIFFLFFTGDIAYAFMVITRHALLFTAPVIDNGVDQFLNLPNAFARPVFLTSLVSLYYLLKEKTKLWQVLTILLFSSLIGIKVYYGIFVVLGLGILTLYHFLKSFLVKKPYSLHSFSKALHDNSYVLIPTVFSLIIAMVIYLPANKASGGLIWQPLYWTSIFLGPDGLNLGFFYALNNSQHPNALVLYLLDALAILLTFFCIHGTRLLGVLGVRTFFQKKQFDFILFLIPGVILFHFLGLFTLQKSGGANVFNFFVVSTVVLSILSAAFLSEFHPRLGKRFYMLLISFCILLSIIRPLNEVLHAVKQLRLPEKYSLLISNDELTGLEYIKNHSKPYMVVQSYPTDPVDHETPYVSYFSDRSTYLSGIALQQTHDIFLPEREKRLKELFNTPGSPGFNEISRGLGIHFIYLKKISDQKLLFTPEKNLVENVYENKSIVIYRIRYP